MSQRIYRIKNGTTVGVSPKVLGPVGAGVLAAVVLFLAGMDTESVSVLLAVLGYGGIGAAAKTGVVESR